MPPKKKPTPKSKTSKPPAKLKSNAKTKPRQSKQSKTSSDSDGAPATKKNKSRVGRQKVLGETEPTIRKTIKGRKGSANLQVSTNSTNTRTKESTNTRTKEVVDVSTSKKRKASTELSVNKKRKKDYETNLSQDVPAKKGLKKNQKANVSNEASTDKGPSVKGKTGGNNSKNISNKKTGNNSGINANKTVPPEKSGPSKANERKKAFDTRKLSAKQYSKWTPMRKETEEFLTKVFETNLNIVLMEMPSSEEYETCQELLNGLISSLMDRLKEAKFPKPALVNLKQLKEKTVEQEELLELNQTLYERVKSACQEYEDIVEQLEKEKASLEDILINEETPIPHPKDMNPVLHEVLSKSTLPEMVTLDSKSSAAFINHSQVKTRNQYLEFRHQCERIGEFVAHKH